MFLFSNSTTKVWRECERKFYYGYLYQGRGIEPIFVDDDLLYGSVVHEQLPLLWQDDTRGIQEARLALEKKLLEDVAWERELQPGGREIKAKEWGRLFVGHCWGIQRVILPYLRERYHLMVAEGDAIRWLNKEKKIGLMAKPDTLLYANPNAPRDEFDISVAHPGCGYLEWKTLKFPTIDWHRQFLSNPQAWTGAMTVKDALDIQIDWFGVCGLIKGTETKDEATGLTRRSSPFCWGYWKDPAVQVKTNGHEPPEGYFKAEDGSEWTAIYTGRKGWVRRSTDEFPGGVEAWVKCLNDEMLNAQFLLTEPVTIDWKLAEEWLRNQKPMVKAAEEYQETASLAKDIDVDPTVLIDMDRVFPRQLSECDYGRFGKSCIFKGPCHGTLGAEAVESGLYRVRQEHHPLVVKLRGEDQ